MAVQAAGARPRPAATALPQASMAKPYPRPMPATGLHAHFSVWTPTGAKHPSTTVTPRRVRTRCATPPSRGCLEARPGSMLIFGPTRRATTLRARRRHAPTGIGWAYERPHHFAAARGPQAASGAADRAFAWSGAATSTRTCFSPPSSAAALNGIEVGRDAARKPITGQRLQPRSCAASGHLGGPRSTPSSNAPEIARIFRARADRELPRHQAAGTALHGPS